MPFFSFLFLSCTVTLCAFVCVLPFSLFPSLFLSLLSFLSVFPSFLSFPFSFLLSIHPSNLSFLLFFLSYFTRLFFLLHWKSYIILHIPFIHFCLLLLLLPSFTGNPSIVCLSFLSFLSFFLPPSFFPLLCHTPFSLLFPPSFLTSMSFLFSLFLSLSLFPPSRGKSQREGEGKLSTVYLPNPFPSNVHPCISQPPTPLPHPPTTPPRPNYSSAATPQAHNFP